MRKRGEIQRLFDRRVSEGFDNAQEVFQEIVVELLLDIRDLLQPPKVKVELDHEGFPVGSIRLDG